MYVCLSVYVYMNESLTHSLSVYFYICVSEYTTHTNSSPFDSKSSNTEHASYSKSSKRERRSYSKSSKRARASYSKSSKRASERAGLMEAAALADVPAEQIKYLCDGHGCGVSHSIRHGGHGKSNLLKHLTEVRYVLKKQLLCSDEELLSAALFHSIYGTEGFQGKVMSLSTRSTLQTLIGERAEFIAYMNCVMDRASLDKAVCEMKANDTQYEFIVMSREELGGESIAMTREQLRDLMIVHFADWAQQVASFPFWNYRREEYANIAKTLGGIYTKAHAEIMSTEPADAEDNLPEMVRARKLGVFDQVMRGEVKYDDLFDQKV